MAQYAIDSLPIRHLINEKGIGAEVRPVIVSGILLVTRRSAIGVFFYLFLVTVPEIFVRVNLAQSFSRFQSGA